MRNTGELRAGEFRLLALEEGLGIDTTEDSIAPVPSDTCCEAWIQCFTKAKMFITNTIQKHFSYTLLLLPVLLVSAPLCLDVFTDYSQALPALYKLEDKSQFAVQLFILICAAVFGAVGSILDDNVWKKLHLQTPIKPLVVLGFCLTFPLFPFSIFVTALVAWAMRDKDTLQACSDLLPMVAASESMEAIMSFVLQSDAYFRGNVQGLELSLIMGLTSLIKSGMDHNTKNKVYCKVQLSGAGAGDMDVSFPIITGPLETLRTSFMSTIALALHYMCEAVSGASCVVLFHLFANDVFVLPAWASFGVKKLSVAWAVIIGAQALLLLIAISGTSLLPRVSMISGSINGSVVLPFPIMDYSVRTLPVYGVRAATQLLISALAYYKLSLVTSEIRKLVLFSIAVASSVGMWMTLLLVRCLFANVSPGLWQNESLAKIREEVRKQLGSGYNFLQPDLTPTCIQHPLLQQFVRICCPVPLDKTTDYQGNGSREFDLWVVRHFKLEMQQITSLTIGSSKKLGVEGCSHLKEMRQITSFTIGDRNDIGAEGCDHLKEMKQVTSFTIGDHNDIGIVGCIHLKEMKQVTSFTIGDRNHIGAEGCSHFKEMKQVTSVTIGADNKIGAEGCSRLKEMKHVTSFAIGGYNKIGAEGCRQLKEMKQVTSFAIGDRNEIGAEGCRHLKEMKQVTNFIIGERNDIGAEGCTHLKEMKQITSFTIGADNKIGAECCSLLKEMKQVTSFTIGDRNQIGAEGCRHLKEMKQITRLTVGAYDKVGAEGCSHIKEMKQVTSLTIGEYNNIGALGCRHLKEMQQLKSLTINIRGNNIDSVAQTYLEEMSCF